MGPLQRRIQERRETEITPIIERRGERKPAWMRRMQDGQLVAKDMTGERAA